LWWNVLTVERWLWCRATPIARALGYRGGVATWIRVLRGLGHVAVHKSGDTIRAATGLVSGSGLRKAALTIFPTRLAGLDPASAFDTTEIGETFSRLFPERSPLCRGDLRPYRQQARSWADVLKAYDVVQGYATEGIVPLLCGTAAWAAYEHGTLREIPFQDSTTGRVAALTYALAPIVFVTNSDVIPSAERLGLDDRHIVFLPHAVDSDRLFRFADEHGPASPPPSDEIILYAPSRQDWIDGDVSLSKGNDRFLRAAAALCDRYAFRLVLAEWGRDLDATRALLEELGLAERVEWVSPLRKRDLWLRYLSSHAVVDQFSVGALGGVAFEAMALGRRVITALDGPNAERFFGEAPPVLAAQTETEIAAALTAVLDDPDDAAGRGAAARAWFAKRHSADRIVELQAAAYRRLLEKALAPAAVDA